jgi:hypothetical protein
MMRRTPPLHGGVWGMLKRGLRYYREESGFWYNVVAVPIFLAVPTGMIYYTSMLLTPVSKKDKEAFRKRMQ